MSTSDTSKTTPTLETQTDEHGPFGDPDPCEEYLIVDETKIPVTGVRMTCYDSFGSPPDVIDFDVVERDGDDLHAFAEFDDGSCVELSERNSEWTIYHTEDPLSVDFETVWERD